MNKHIGSTLDSLFEELGEKEEVERRITHRRRAPRSGDKMKLHKWKDIKKARFSEQERADIEARAKTELQPTAPAPTSSKGKRVRRKGV
jgi:hypothetical protein